MDVLDNIKEQNHTQCKIVNIKDYTHIINKEIDIEKLARKKSIERLIKYAESLNW